MIFFPAMALTYVGDTNAQKNKDKAAAARRESKSSAKQRLHHRQHHQSQQQLQQQQQQQLQQQHQPSSSLHHGSAPRPLPRNVPPTRSRNLTMRSRSAGGRLEPLGRSSLRSKVSKTSTASSEQTRMKAFKNCCRKAVEFMFTQVT